VTRVRPRCSLVILMLALVALHALPTAAQASPDTGRDTSTIDPAAGAFLPPAQVLGPDWTLVSTSPLDLPAETFRAGAYAVYTGPAGARILAAAMLVTDARVAVRRSWEDAADLYHHYSGELKYDSDRDDVLDRLPPPPGCVEARRIDGTARQLGLETGIPMGLTLCAADPDVILLTVVSGAVNSLSGYEASDAVASLMLGATTATPTAG
jgi:hypothetical protein